MAINKKDKNIEAQEASGDLQSQDLQKQSTSSSQAAPSGGVSLSSTSSLGGATAQAPKTDSSKMTSAGKRFQNLKKFRTQNQDEGELAGKVVGRLRDKGKGVTSDVQAANELLTSNIATEDKNITAGTQMGTDEVVKESDKFIYTPEKAADGSLVKNKDDKYTFGDNKDNESSFVDAATYTKGEGGDFGELDYDLGGKVDKGIKGQEDHRQNLRTSEGRYKELLGRFGSGRREYNRGTSLMDNMILNSGKGKGIIDTAAANAEGGLGFDQRQRYTTDAERRTDETTRLQGGYSDVAKDLTDQLGTATASAKTAADAKYDNEIAAAESTEALITKSKNNPELITADEAKQLGWSQLPDGTWSNMGVTVNDLGTNELDLTKGNVLTAGAKSQLSGLGALGGNFGAGELEQYSAQRELNEAGNVVNTSQGGSDIEGGVKDSGYKDTVAAKASELGGYQQGVESFQNEVQGGEGSILKDFHKKRSTRISGGQYASRSPSESLGIPEDQLAGMSNKDLNNVANSQLSAPSPVSGMDFNTYYNTKLSGGFGGFVKPTYEEKLKYDLLQELKTGYEGQNATLTQKVTDITGSDTYTTVPQ